MKKAIIAVGTNMGNRLANINGAVSALEKVPLLSVVRCSSVYETEPWGYTQQQNFYNAVVEVETQLDPHALLGVCLGIEAGFGRVRSIKNGPRVLDLDLLLYEGYSEDGAPVLTVPHPGIGERDFVLVPLKELYDGLVIYGFDYSKNFLKINSEKCKKVSKITTE